MADVTSADVGQPVTIITDGTATVAVAEPVVTTATANMEVKYVPTTGGTDDR